jgi:hypothetical protein
MRFVLCTTSLSCMNQQPRVQLMMRQPKPKNQL